MLERLADKATAQPAARWLLPVERSGAPHIEDRPALGILSALKIPARWIETYRRSRAS